ncbi:unnamed protein product [Gadus morhua 'NCC']
MMSKGIKEVNPYCSFAFKRHAVKTVESGRCGPLFTSSAYCCFKDCPVQVQLPIEDDSLMANLNFTGEFLRHSRRQLVRRPVRAGEREVLTEALQTKLPRSLFLEKLQGLGDKGYGLNEYLITPLAHPNTDQERNFNSAHAHKGNNGAMYRPTQGQVDVHRTARLAIIGGTTLEVRVRRMMANLLTNELASGLNWAGKKQGKEQAKQKRPFKDLAMPV